MGRRVGGPKRQGPPPTLNGGRQVQPAVVQRRQQKPNLGVVGPNLGGASERRNRLVNPTHLAERHPQVALPFEADGVETNCFAEGGKAVVPLPEVAEDDAQRVVIAGYRRSGCDGQPGQLQRRPQPFPLMSHHGQEVNRPRVPRLSPQHLAARSLGARPIPRSIFDEGLTNRGI
jgi:hypothetical protein